MPAAGSPELDKLLNEANTELDPQKRVDLTYQADQMIWEEGHSVTLYQRPDLVACKKTLVNFGALGYADIGYSIIGFKSYSHLRPDPTTQYLWQRHTTDVAHVRKEQICS